MTAIAFRDGWLASDSGVFSDDGIVLGSENKITNVKPGWWVAGAGDSCSIVRIEKLIRASDGDPENIPLDDWLGCSASIDDHSDALIIGPKKGMIWTCRTSMGAERVRAPFASEGIAYRECLAAMHAGATAWGAIRIACKMHTLCKLPVRRVKCWS